MKNILWGLLVSILFSLSAKAQDEDKSKKGESKESAYLSVSLNNEVVKYKFDTIKDLEENSNKILDEITFDSEKDKDDKCKLVIEISTSISNITISTTVIGTVRTSCDKIAAEAKKLNDKLITVIK
jgi:hypothetical protein